MTILNSGLIVPAKKQAIDPGALPFLETFDTFDANLWTVAPLSGTTPPVGVATSGGNLIVTNYGTGNYTHGPYLIRSISNWDAFDVTFQNVYNNFSGSQWPPGFYFALLSTTGYIIMRAWWESYNLYMGTNSSYKYSASYSLNATRNIRLKRNANLLTWYINDTAYGPYSETYAGVANRIYIQCTIYSNYPPGTFYLGGISAV